MPAKLGLAVLIVAVSLAVVGCRSTSDAGPATISKLQAKINQNFKDPQAHYDLGKLYQEQGNWDKAAYEYNATLNFDPVNRDAQASMVKVLRLGGDEQRAAAMARDYLKQVSFAAEDSIALGRAFEEREINDYALMAYEQAVKLSPKSAVPYKQLGFYYLGKKDKDAAKTYFVRSFELDPYQKDVALELGRLGIRVTVPEAAPAPAKTKAAK
jgi:tetratricopeptide (TPR) repeat protein